MKRKYRRKPPYQQVRFRLPDHLTVVEPNFDTNGFWYCDTMYPKPEVFDWMDEHAPDYCFSDLPGHAEFVVKNMQQFIMARLMFGVTQLPHDIKWKPRKRTHRHNARV